MSGIDKMLLTEAAAGRQFELRLQELRTFADAHNDNSFKESFIGAYLEDTAFLRSNIYEREILAPQGLINTLISEATGLGNHNIMSRRPLGKVAILLPKNGIGITAAKSLASSFLMGNANVVKLPSQLRHSSSVYREFVRKYLPNVSVVTDEMPSQKFIESALIDPTVNAVVIYGDDTWFHQYLNLARRTRTKVIFEGPGNDPLVVYPGADLNKVVENAIACGLLNGGQSCSALERFFVHEQVHDDFLHLLCKGLSNVKLGNPNDIGVVIGPTMSEKVLSRIENQISESLKLGAELAMGGEVIRSDYRNLGIMKPTILTNCTTQMSVVKKETFGPVFPIIRFGDQQHELIEWLDDTDYGLNASIYGDYNQEVFDYLGSTHRNLLLNSTFSCAENARVRLLDGGYKNSGFIWDWQEDVFVRKEGRRWLIEELSIRT
jgi:acyl-CoA reductase-like NAD-dependent aldehyde dehydrogenase